MSYLGLLTWLRAIARRWLERIEAAREREIERYMEIGYERVRKENMDHSEMMYQRAVERVRRTGDASPEGLMQSSEVGGRVSPGCSYGGALLHLERMEREGIVSPIDEAGKRRLLSEG